jgi:uncharacterized protein (TIGR00255 family)
MTGYGRGEKANEIYSVTIDLKSINHRYLEFYFKIPKAYYFLEDRLRRDISSKIARGKLEVIVNIERFNPAASLVELDKTLLNSYITAIQGMKKALKLKGKLQLSTVINLPNIFKLNQPEENQDKLMTVIGETVVEAVNSLLKAREAEGISLCKDLQARITFLGKLRNDLLVLAPDVVTNYQEKLVKRIQELAGGVDVDPNRLATEIAIFADKSDINEELVRTQSHLQQFIEALQLTEPVGRRLDFIIQELNREINTVGSKANDLRITQIVIEFKAELEKIREQIQNIE